MYRQRLLLGTMALFLVGAGIVSAAPKDTIRVGYIEGGDYYQHVLVRNLFIKSLSYMLAESHEVQYASTAIRNAGWKRDSCRASARQLARNGSLDVILAVGPWVVEDLVQAGCKTPIVAAYQPSPTVSLPGAASVPVLTQDTRQKIEQDMELIQRLLKPKKVAVLGFTDQGKPSPLVDAVRKTRAGGAWEVVSVDAYDANGTFAFFKAYSQLPKDIDALYIGPLWRLELSFVDEFLHGAARGRVKVFSFDPTLVERGALGSTAYGWPPALALFHAGQAAQLLTGGAASQLPTVLTPSSYAVLNQATARTAGMAIPDDLLVTELIIGSLAEPATASLSVTEAIHRTLDGSPTMALAQALADAALAEYAKFSEFIPNVQAFGEIARVDDHTVDAQGGRLSNNLMGAGLSLDQTVFSWTALQQLKARHDLKVAGEQGIEGVRQLLALAVIEAYASLLEARQNLQHVTEYRMRVDELVQLALAREAVGLAGADEFRRWDARRWEAIAQQATFEFQQQGARYALNALLNQPLTEPIEPDSQLFAGDIVLRETIEMIGGFRRPMAQANTAEQLLTFARDWHPELQELDRRLAHQERWMSGSNTRWIPRVGFRAELGISDSLASGFSSVEESPRWKVGLNFSLPLFGPKSGAADRRAARGLVDQYQARRDSAELAIQRQVYSQIQQLVTASTRTVALFESTKQLRAAVPELASQYAAGHIRMGECAQELGSLYSSQIARTQSQYFYFVTEARLLQAVGSPLNQLQGALGKSLEALLKE